MFFQKSTIWFKIEINRDEEGENSKETIEDYIILPQKLNSVLVW